VVILAQLVLNGLVSGAIVALPAIGFNVVFAVLRFTNFSLAAHMAVGAFAGYVVNTLLGQSAPVALLAAFVVAGIVGVLADRLALRPLRAFGALTLAIASMAVNLVLENLLRLQFGSLPRGLDVPMQRDWLIGPFRIGPQQLEDFSIAVVVMLLVFLLLGFTSLGRAMRAVADNPTLADIKGIDPERMAAFANFLGMGLGGVAGVLLALDSSVTPDMGFGIILSVFAASVVGGLGNIRGAVVGGLLIGVAEEVSTIALPTDYRSAIGFLAIIIALAFFPRGILALRTA